MFLGKVLLLAAVTVPTCPDFSCMLLDSMVGAPYQLVPLIQVTADLQLGQYQDPGLELGPQS